MRILMCAGLYDVGGFSTVMETLADALGERGHDVVIGALLFKSIPSGSNYSVSRIPFGNFLKLRRFLECFDVIHSHHAITNYLALASHRPFVYHHHGAPNLGRDYLFRLSMLSSIKLMKHSFDAVISGSDSGVLELENYFNLDNVHLISNGLDTNIFKLGLEEKFRRGKPQFLFVGNLYKHKKVEELILAMKELIKVYPKAYLQIVGDGRMYNFLNRFIAELKLGQRVELVGCISRDDLLRYYYASCDVYVTASRYEVCPMPLFEAMGCGKAIVASSIPPHVELLNKSKAGVTYTKGDIGDLYKKMIKTYEESDRYENNALQFAKEHDWSLVAERVLKIYDILVHVQ